TACAMSRWPGRVTPLGTAPTAAASNSSTRSLSPSSPLFSGAGAAPGVGDGASSAGVGLLGRLSALGCARAGCFGAGSCFGGFAAFFAGVFPAPVGWPDPFAWPALDPPADFGERVPATDVTAHRRHNRADGRLCRAFDHVRRESPG